jgi:ABC-type glycerol-3-phosphate transport system substrate-binding protein
MFGRRSFCLIICTLLLTACSAIQPESRLDPTATPSSEVRPTPEETGKGASSESDRLTLWVPPTFSPDADSTAADTFQERLKAFEASHDDLTLQVRTKAEQGPSGLLETVRSASIAAPQALPDVIILNQASLNVATLKGYVQPLDGLVEKPEPPGWYDHALEVARLDEGLYGLPFASDAQILVYRKDRYQAAPITWSDLVNADLPFLFPAGDPAAMFTLAQYTHHGGRLTDDGGLPMIDVASLAEVLTFYHSALSNGVISPSLRQYANAEETWEALRVDRGSSGVAPLRGFLTSDTFDRFGASPLPARNEPGVSPSVTWSWVVVAQDPAKRELAAELIAWLIEPEFLGPWSYELGLMPATAQALSIWPEGEASALVSNLVTVSNPAPSTETSMTFGSFFNEAVSEVLTEKQPPLSAAQSAATALRAQQNN